MELDMFLAETSRNDWSLFFGVLDDIARCSSLE